MHKNKVHLFTALLLLPLLIVKISYALPSDNKIKRHEEFLESIGAYKCGINSNSVDGIDKYPFKCQLISSPFTEELLTKELQDLKTYDPSLPRTWYFFGLNNAWGYHDKQTHLQELEKNLSKIIKTLQNHPEIVVLMAPEQQAVWQEYCNKEEKTLNKINDFFLGQ